MYQGFVAIHRQIRDNKLWFSEKFTGGQAWVDLIMLANHKFGCLNIRGNYVEIKRGQIARSKKNLGEDWKWSEKKVNNFLKFLQKEGQIKLVKTPSIVIIEIINYDIYQQKEGQKKDKKNTAEEKKMPNNNGNTVNNDQPEKNSPLPPQKILKVDDIMRQLDDTARSIAKSNAPGWDIYHLAGIYAEGVNNKKREMPRSIKLAFPAWCGIYTKRKQL